MKKPSTKVTSLSVAILSIALTGSNLMAQRKDSGEERSQHASAAAQGRFSGNHSSRDQSSSLLRTRGMNRDRIATTNLGTRFTSPVSNRNFASSQGSPLRVTDDGRSAQRFNDAQVQRSGATTYTGSHGNFNRFNRDQYIRRNEHHSYDWYRNNGWTYDTGYWQRYHRHRYFNDSLGLVIFDTTGPYSYSYPYDTGYAYPYDTGYSYPYDTTYSSVYPAEVEPQVVYQDFSSDLNTLLAVQEQLARAGYYRGPIDGIIGAGTLSAIIAYQEDFGLPVTGRIDTPLLQSMRLIQ
jgi:hypothetical protein